MCIAIVVGGNERQNQQNVLEATVGETKFRGECGTICLLDGHSLLQNHKTIPNATDDYGWALDAEMLRMQLYMAELGIADEQLPTPMAGVEHIEEPTEVPVQVLPPTPVPVRKIDVPPTPYPAKTQAQAPMGSGDIASAICALPWPCQEALYVANHESGIRWVFNLAGSGACGPFQTLPCVGMVVEGSGDIDAHLAEAYRKWKACSGGSFQCHWYNWW